MMRSAFFLSNTKYLGEIIYANRRKREPSRMTVTKNPHARNIATLQSFLWIAIY